ncbi:MAG: 30S ribosomal protein S12 methylthiotransferase RimO [Deltaproteobacteria bacterium]|nr:30S ribosomal protein S12 methylthiotransferase RimO [Deltaproteobacteria bacterium]
MKTFSIVSLGCHKNLVDSEYICERLIQAGYRQVSDESQAATIVVNTCAFLRCAVEESIQTMLECIEEGKEVICAGCLVSRYRDELLAELPEIRLFAGPGTYANIPVALEKNQSYLAPVFDAVVSRSFCSTGSVAYLKISEGCSNRCNYCLIPALRGELISKPMNAILDESRGLVERGAREIILVGQDLGSYGRDIGLSYGLETIIEQISTIEGITWIRVMYVHPASLSPELIELISSNPKVCPYIDLPIQHVSEKVLRAMGRRGGAAAIRKAFELLDPHEDIWVRSTVMVGHPGEDQEDFEELKAFISEGHIEHLGVFGFSPEPGTPSYAMRKQVDNQTIELRRNSIMSIQQAISCKKLGSLIGKTIQVLVEDYHPETELLLKARASFQAPDVDGMVIINQGNATFGNFYPVEIRETLEYDLIGRII